MQDNNNKSHILIIDDDERLRNLLQEFLKKHNYRVDNSCDATSARKFLQHNRPDLIILDVMMPNEDGFTFLSKLRTNDETPVIMLTALDSSDDKIKGLRLGSDDYLAKPFEPEELILRVESILKRTKKTKVEYVAFGDFKFNLISAKLLYNNNEVFLTSSEATMLKTLAKNKNQAVSRDYLSAVNNNISERAIDVQLARLRKKIERDPRKPKYIMTERNIGYKLVI